MCSPRIVARRYNHVVNHKGDQAARSLAERLLRGIAPVYVDRMGFRVKLIGAARSPPDYPAAYIAGHYE